MAIPIDKAKVDAINANINPNTTPVKTTEPINPPTTPIPVIQTQDQLKAKIATGNFSASDAKQYNDMT
jgi:hypothetical protein